MQNLAELHLVYYLKVISYGHISVIKAASYILFYYFHCHYSNCLIDVANYLTKVINAKQDGGRLNLTARCGFSKTLFSQREGKILFFCKFLIIEKHIFPEIFIENPQVVWKICGHLSSILATFINLLDFSHFLLANKLMNQRITDDVSIILPSTYYKPTINRFFNNFIKLY